jgi:hypothetical protein
MALGSVPAAFIVLQASVKGAKKRLCVLMSSGEDIAENVIEADHQVAVPVPRYNEERAVARVVADFRAALPAFLSIAVGLILDTVTRGRRELKLLSYLALRSPGAEWRRS